MCFFPWLRVNNITCILLIGQCNLFSLMEGKTTLHSLQKSFSDSWTLVRKLLTIRVVQPPQVAIGNLRPYDT